MIGYPVFPLLVEHKSSGKLTIENNENWRVNLLDVVFSTSNSINEAKRNGFEIRVSDLCVPMLRVRLNSSEFLKSRYEMHKFKRNAFYTAFIS